GLAAAASSLAADFYASLDVPAWFEHPVQLYWLLRMQKVSTIDVRQRIGDLLNRVALRHDEFVIERKGKPLAALVPIERLEQMRRFARRHALELLEEQ